MKFPDWLCSSALHGCRRHCPGSQQVWAEERADARGCISIGLKQRAKHNGCGVAVLLGVNRWGRLAANSWQKSPPPLVRINLLLLG